MLSINKPKLIKDSPVDGVDLLFGHKEIGDSILDILEISEDSLTIGLFGGWGTGKSSVVCYVDKVCKERSIPTIIFDVWKHSDDALRRTFLVELVKQLKEQKALNEDFNLNQNLLHQTEENQDITIYTKVFSWIRSFLQNKNVQKSIVFLVIVLISFFVYIVNRFNWTIALSIFFQLAVAIYTSSLLILNKQLFDGIIDFLRSSMPDSMQTIFQGLIPISSKAIIFDRFQDPHEFEEEFIRIIETQKNKKIIITFDNLDRIERHLLITALTTIKTFLDPAIKRLKEKKLVLFVIPCDEKSVKGVVEEYYSGTKINSDEYLRKFFNTTLSIPRFIQTELESFTKRKLNETNIEELKNNDKVSWLITKAFRENPRQIIQFVNLLTTNIILAYNRMEELPENFLKENVASLTSYLVLKQLYPRETEAILEHQINSVGDDEINEIHEFLKNEKFVNYMNFINFVNQTKEQIPINNLKLLSSLRKSDPEKHLEGIEAIFVALEDNEYDDAKALFKKLVVSEKYDLEQLNLVIKAKVASIKNNTVKSVFCGALLTLLEEEKVILYATTYGSIFTTIADFEVFKALTIEPMIIQSQLSGLGEKSVKTIISHWIGMLEEVATTESQGIEDKYIYKVIEILSTYNDQLSTVQKNKLKDIFVKPVFIKKFDLIKHISQSPNLVSLYFSSAFIKGLMSTVPPETAQIQYFSDVMDVFNLMDADQIDQSDSNAMFSKIIDISRAIQANPDIVDIQKDEVTFNDAIQNYLQTWSFKDSEITEEFIQTLISNTQKITIQNSRLPYIATFIKIINVIDTVRNDRLVNIVREFIREGDLESLMNLVSDYDIDILNENIYSEVLEKSLNNDDYFMFLLNKTEISNYEELLGKLAERDIGRFVRILEKIKHSYDLPSSMIEGLLNNISDSNLLLSKAIFELASSIIKNEDVTNKSLFQTKVVLFLKNLEKTIQDAGKEAFDLGKAKKILSKQKVREIAKEVFDWLKNDSFVPNKLQYGSLLVICEGYEQFNKTEQGLFVQFVFDNLIRTSNNKEVIVCGFEILEKLGIKYLDSKQNFKDLQSKYQASSSEVQEVMRGGLNRIPKSKSKDEELYMNFFGL